MFLKSKYSWISQIINGPCCELHFSMNTFSPEPPAFLQSYRDLHLSAESSGFDPVTKCVEIAQFCSACVGSSRHAGFLNPKTCRLGWA